MAFTLWSSSMSNAITQTSLQSLYPRVVLQEAIRSWPQVIPAQVLHTRLAAYAEHLTDANFLHGVCAVCARFQRPQRPPPARSRVGGVRGQGVNIFFVGKNLRNDHLGG